MPGADTPAIDWDALIGWALVAGPMVLIVAVIWVRRWRRDPKRFGEELGREAPGMTTRGAPTHRRF